MALTRGRDTNSAYLYERIPEHGDGHDTEAMGAAMHRGRRSHADRLLRTILANDKRPTTVHGFAATTQVGKQAECARAAVVRRCIDQHTGWRDELAGYVAEQNARDRGPSLDRSDDYGLELCD